MSDFTSLGFAALENDYDSLTSMYMQYLNYDEEISHKMMATSLKELIIKLKEVAKSVGMTDDSKVENVSKENLERLEEMNVKIKKLKTELTSIMDARISKQ